MSDKKILSYKFIRNQVRILNKAFTLEEVFINISDPITYMHKNRFDK